MVLNQYLLSCIIKFKFLVLSAFYLSILNIYIKETKKEKDIVYWLSSVLSFSLPISSFKTASLRQTLFKLIALLEKIAVAKFGFFISVLVEECFKEVTSLSGSVECDEMKSHALPRIIKLFKILNATNIRYARNNKIMLAGLADGVIVVQSTLPIATPSGRGIKPILRATRSEASEKAVSSRVWAMSYAKLIV